MVCLSLSLVSFFPIYTPCFFCFPSLPTDDANAKIGEIFWLFLANKCMEISICEVLTSCEVNDPYKRWRWNTGSNNHFLAKFRFGRVCLKRYSILSYHQHKDNHWFYKQVLCKSTIIGDFNYTNYAKHPLSMDKRYN